MKCFRYGNSYYLWILAILLGACQPDPAQKQPNILWIVADDLGTDLGCYGETAVHSPNLDRLAEQSILFENHFTVTAVCSPSRSSLITGMYPTSINCHQHRTQFKQALPDSVLPITEYFRKAGYYVSNGSFRNPEKFGKTDYNFVHEVSDMYDGPDWTGRGKGQPFFAQIQIFYPHRPFYPDSIHPVNPAEINIPPYYPDHPITRKDWALYLETVQLVDREVGKVLERLEYEGLLDETIIFFFGDQGRPHVRAKQFMYDGGIHTPLMVRYPDGKNAGTRSQALVSNVDIPVSSLHLAGIDVPKHIQGQDFLSETLAARSHIVSMRDRRDETEDRIRAVRTARFKYIRNYFPDRPYTQFNAYKKRQYPVLTLMELMHKQGNLSAGQAHFMASKRPAEELYDLEADPYELHNLAADYQFHHVKEGLINMLDQWLEEMDMGIYPEDRQEIEYELGRSKERFKKAMEARGLSAEISDEAYLEWWTNKLGL